MGSKPPSGMVSQEEMNKLRNRMQNLEKANASQKKKIAALTALLKESQKEQLELRKETNSLRCKINCANYHGDGIEQYTRRENIRIHDVPETLTEKDDVLDAIIDRANYALSKSTHYSSVTVSKNDIQRAHRVGKPKVNKDGVRVVPEKPRKIICRFKSYKLRQQIMYSKKALRSHRSYGGSFITEDLTPFRSKLLWYLKNKIDGKLVNLHTRDGNIRAQKKEAQGEDDKWYVIRNPDDLFKIGITFNVSELNEDYLSFEVYDLVDTTPISNRFEELEKIEKMVET